MNDENDNLNKHNGQSDIATKRLQNISRSGLNAVTGGAWNKVRNTPIIGAAAKRGEEKIANKLGNNRVVNKLANHQRPNIGAQTKKQGDNSKNNSSVANNSVNNDVGSQNLKKSLANKTHNLWNRKKKNADNNSSSNNEESNTSNDTSNNEERSDTNLDGNTTAKLKRMLIIKLAIFGIAAFALFVFVVAFAAVISGGNIFQSMPVVAVKTYGEKEFESIAPSDSSLYKDEIAYYKKLQEVDKKNNGNVNINYVNAVLLEIYYEFDYEYDKKLEDTLGIDFAKMTSLVDDFYKVINDANSTDYSINGVIYNALKESKEFKDYYKDILKNQKADDVLERVFDLAEQLDAYENLDDTVITDDTKVTVNDQSDKKKSSKTLTINEYITDSIYANSSSLSSETVKAYTIAYSTNLISQNKKLTIDSSSASATNSLCSVKEGCSYNEDGDLVSGKGAQSSKNTFFYDGGYYYKPPLSDAEIKSLNNNINSVFGNVLVNSDGTYPTLDISKINGLGSGSYQNILSSSYGNYTIKNVGEDSYVLDASYGTETVRTEVIFYDQNDYLNSFCGLKKETIESSGCGVTSMAMVASTYEKNKKYDPIYMNQEAINKKMCGANSGTYQAFFGKEASTMNYKYVGGSKYNKSLLNTVLKHLSQGHLVIARMGPTHFTGGGHYIVLGGVDPTTKKVYVYDPNHRDNSRWRKTGNGWYSFNDIIVKEAYNFYVIWKG